MKEAAAWAAMTVKSRIAMLMMRFIASLIVVLDCNSLVALPLAVGALALVALLLGLLCVDALLGGAFTILHLSLIHI